MVSPSSLIEKLKNRYKSCSSYSDKGEFTVKVSRAGYHETFPFRTHFVRPGQVYLKFRENANTVIIRSKNTGVVLLTCEIREDKKVFVPFRKYKSLESGLKEAFHHELFPVFSLILLNESLFENYHGIFDCDFSIIEENQDEPYYLLRAETEQYGQVDLFVDKEESCLRKARIQGSVKSVECRFKKTKFNKPIPESVYNRIRLKV